LSSTPITAEVAERAQRADAVRNRQRVLDAALEAFAESGFDCQMPEIARRAQVGVGTVYRHFPHKQDLLAALADRHFDQLEQLAQEALDSDLPPWEAFTSFLWNAGHLVADNRGMAEVVGQRQIMQEAADPREQLRVLGSELIRRAQETGHVRQDATVADIPTVMCGLGHIAAIQDVCPVPMSWERYLTLMLDGLKRQPGETAQK
jgi:AcrR family transcriptional regulator